MKNELRVILLLAPLLLLPLPATGEEGGALLLSMAKGVLKVTSSVEGARVFINGVEEGKTPFVRMLEPGNYRIRVFLQGYDTVESDIRVISRKVALFEAVLIRNTGSLKIESELERIRVFMDGREIGTTPLKVIENLKEGRYSLRFEKEDYSPYSTEVEIKRDVTSRIFVKLRPIKGWVTLSSDPPGLPLSIDGKEAGRTPQRYSLKEGEHLFRMGGGEVPIHYGRFVITAGEEKDILIDVAEKGGGLKVKADVDGAQVYLNGHLLGATPLKVKKILNPSRYDVIVLKEGVGRVDAPLVIKGGEVEDLRLLLRKGELLAGLPPEKGSGKEKKIYERWWFWTAAGAILAGMGGSGYLYYLNNRQEATPHDISFQLP